MRSCRHRHHQPRPLVLSPAARRPARRTRRSIDAWENDIDVYEHAELLVTSNLYNAGRVTVHPGAFLWVAGNATMDQLIVLDGAMVSFNGSRYGQAEKLWDIEVGPQDAKAFTFDPDERNQIVVHPDATLEMEGNLLAKHWRAALFEVARPLTLHTPHPTRPTMRLPLQRADRHVKRLRPNPRRCRARQAAAELRGM